MEHGAQEIELRDEAETQALAQRFAAATKPGQSILLTGDLGTGKTTFARSFIQHRFGQLIEVPSPTFTLVQTYDHPDGDIWHCDLYRLSDPFEVIELGLDEAFESAICLIEWPDRLGDLKPRDAIDLHLQHHGAGRLASIKGLPLELVNND